MRQKRQWPALLAMQAAGLSHWVRRVTGSAVKVSGGGRVSMAWTLLCVTSIRKPEVTTCIVRCATIGDMEAFPDDLREFWQRLRWARMRSPFETAADTARSLGLKPGTYRTYERPTDENGRKPDLSEIQRIAKKLAVSWTWLASGSGRPDDGAVEVDDRAVLVAQRIDKLPPEKQLDALNAALAVIDAIGRTGTGG
jgi:transcriptional regulator with XRE-family HTH domain